MIPKTRLYILLFFLVFQAGCVYKSLIYTDTNCLPPCWRSIQPGVTTENQLLVSLQKMPDIKNGSIINEGPWKYLDDVIDFDLSSKETAKAYIRRDKVILIVFENIVDVKFQDAIQKYGSPKYIQIFQIPPIDFFDIEHTYITAISPEKGTAYGFDAHKAIHIFPDAINPNSSISELYYFDPSSYQFLLVKGMFSGGIPISPIYFHSWQGYGIIATKYP